MQLIVVLSVLSQLTLGRFASKKSGRHGRNFERYTYSYFKRLGVYRLVGTVTPYMATLKAGR